MRTARILYTEFLDENKNIKIGGVETYICNLQRILNQTGYKVVIYQDSKAPYEIKLDDIKVVGVGNGNGSKFKLKYISSHESPDYVNDLLIFATDMLIVKNRFRKSIAIQHGIAFDVTKDTHAYNIENFLTIIKGALRSIIKYNRFKHCNNVVCVDYNFLNWYRTQIAHIDTNMFVIPNFARTSTLSSKNNHSTVSIIFARRFVTYRGTKLFTKAIVSVLENYPDIHVTIAGTGPDEQWMHHILDQYPQITFTQYKAEDSIEFHQKFDIAVIPTLGSEGTSLSLLEAMSAGCAVIASNVGGITNIILDGYNGKLIQPVKEELVEAIEDLIVHTEKRIQMSRRGQETVHYAFSYEKWKDQWIRTIKYIEK